MPWLLKLVTKPLIKMIAARIARKALKATMVAVLEELEPKKCNGVTKADTARLKAVLDFMDA